VRPTGTGIGVLLFGAVLVVAGVVLGFPELVAVGAGAAVLVVLALVAVARHPAVDARSPADARVERGSRASVPITLVLSRSRALGGLRLRTTSDGTVVGLPSLRPGRATTVGVHVPTGRRGRHTLGPWRLERVDPWGLAVRTVARVTAVDVLVLPRVHDVAVSALPMAEAQSRSAEEAGTTHVATLREYVVGDELRQVHWRSSAKTGHLMVRQYVDSRRPGVDVVLDTHADAYVDAAAFEEAVDAAASIAVSVATTGVPTSVATSAGASARAGRGRHAGMLELLAEVELDGSDTGRPADQSPGTAVGRRGDATVVYVTGTTAASRVRPGRHRVVVRVGGTDGAGGGAVLHVRTAADLVGLPALTPRSGRTSWSA
jgi:uncharacterized protein (DUF58 family)